MQRSVLASGMRAEPIGRQLVHGVSGPQEAAVYQRDALGAGDRFAGPAIVTQLDATTLVASDWEAEVLASGALSIIR
jgi:N-methylhydantoinase A